MGLMDNIKNAQEMAQNAQQMAQQAQGGAMNIPGAEDMAQADSLARISQSGAEAQATIQSATPTGKPTPGGGEQYSITAEVRPAGGDPYTATFNQNLVDVQMKFAQPGTEVTVKIDPQDPNTMLIWGEAG